MKRVSRMYVFGVLAAAVLLQVLLVSVVGHAVPQAQANSATVAAQPAKQSSVAKPSATGPAATTSRKVPASKPAPAKLEPGKPLMADQVYSNIQVLRGLTEDQFMDTMAFISVGIGSNCVSCHDTGIAAGSPERWKAFAVDTPMKKLGRQMIILTKRINAEQFGGAQVVTCFTCHRGELEPPPVIPQLDLQYAVPTNEVPEQYTKQDSNAPPPSQILDKYVAAVGGSDRVAALKTYIATGTYSGYDTDFEADPIKIYHRAPDQQTWTIQLPFGERSRVFNGQMGWNATPDTSQPLPVLPIIGGRVSTERTMAQIAFPAGVGQGLTKLIVGATETINGGEPGNRDLPDRQVWVVQGLDSARLPVKLYFEKNSGLLVRVLTYANTKLGIIPTQIDYADFRDVSGIKLPFHWVVTATDGQNVFNLTDIQVNAPIDDSRFAMPAPPKLLTPPARTTAQNN